MKEMQQIDNYIGKVHKKFMNTKATTETHMTRDLWFTMNLMVLAVSNLKRFSSTTSEPKKVYNKLINDFIKNKDYNVEFIKND